MSRLNLYNSQSTTVVLTVCLAGFVFCFSGYAADGLQPVFTNKIEVGGFWAAQYKRITEKWLPHCIEQMEEGGRGRELLNLVNTAKVLKGQEHEKYTGAPWSDAYVYNTVESICMALAIDPEGDRRLAAAQKFLRGKLEEWIPIILAAQMDSGYIHSYHTVNGYKHYSDINAHEFYVMGYFIEMGVAHYRMTGGSDRRLYNAALKLADHLDATFGPAPKRTWKNGHAGMEYALCRLARLVNDVQGPGKGDKYVKLARHFLDHQHEIEPNPYNQSERPAVEMKDATGHAVRATYFYTAMADMALLEGDADYLHAVDRLWDSAINRKHYLTGGVGASHNGEAFSADFDLRNDGYCESCAGCGMGFWADRMHRIHHAGNYHDVIERVLYNNILGALELSGENFFYQNPLASSTKRYPWHGCPCCVGNIPRALLTLKDIMYAANSAGNVLYMNHFVDSKVTVKDLAGTDVTLVQETGYPWKGQVNLTLNPEKKVEFMLRIRIPDRTESDLYTALPDLDGQYSLKINGKGRNLRIRNGYVSLKRKWQKGDKVTLELPMEVQRIHCDDRVIVDLGRVALIRGPLVYNFEQVDNRADVRNMVVKPDIEFKAVWKADMLEGIMAIEGGGMTAVPNFTRLNRGGYSQVWMTEVPDKVIDPVQLADMMRKVEPVKRPDLDKRAIDRVVVADLKSERQHKVTGENTSAGEFRNRGWRHAGGGWFSYRLKVDPEGQNILLCTYWGSDIGNRVFDIVVDGRKIAQQKLDRNEPDKFFDVEYKIPLELTKGKETIEVKFTSAAGNATAGGVFDIWMLKTSEI